MAIISLITDFGLQDEYVGLLKAVILGIDPTATLVDLSHAVEPRDVSTAAFLLESSWTHFPPGSIHLVVVDPGVGTRRALLYLEAGGQRFLAPDNGVLTLVIDPHATAVLRRVDHPALWRARVSPTFHGRDILAPVAAYLARGGDAAALGPEIASDAITRLADLRAERSPDGRIIGRIVHIDRFGNLVSNIPAAGLRPSGPATAKRPVEIHLAGQAIIGLCNTYADGEAGRPLALIGSRGYLEIAVNQGSAQRHFGVCKGEAVEVRPGG